MVLKKRKKECHRSGPWMLKTNRSVWIRIWIWNTAGKAAPVLLLYRFLNVFLIYWSEEKIIFSASLRVLCLKG
jgi:hypothetical protein